MYVWNAQKSQENVIIVRIGSLAILGSSSLTCYWWNQVDSLPYTCLCFIRAWKSSPRSLASVPGTLPPVQVPVPSSLPLLLHIIHLSSGAVHSSQSLPCAFPPLCLCSGCPYSWNAHQPHLCYSPECSLSPVQLPGPSWSFPKPLFRLLYVILDLFSILP